MAADPAVGRADAGAPVVASPAAQAAQLMFERHGARVLAYCQRRLGSRDEAEDALQTTFLHACRGLQRGVVPVTEIAWLLKIAHNVCLSHWDSDRRRGRLELVRDPERLETVESRAPADRDELHALETALADLTDLQRRAILLREWRGLSYQEIAVELKLSSSAVETLIFRARRALAGSLEQQDVGRARTRLARCLDFGGLLAGLKSLLGGSGAAKLAATALAVGTAMLAGSVPDVATSPPAAEPPPAAGPVVDPATAPAARAAGATFAGAEQAPAKEPRAGKRVPRSQPAPVEPGPSTERSPSLGGTVGQVTSTVDGTVNALEATATGAVETVTGTVGSVPDIVAPVTGTVGSVPDIVAPVTDLVDEVLDGDGSLLP